MLPTSGSNRVFSALTTSSPGLWPFIPAGYPSLEATEHILRMLGRLPIRGIELGFPFSDPIADGPVIQQAFTHALANGTRVSEIFRTVSRVRSEINYPIMAMVSASIICRIGAGEFFQNAQGSGFDGLIVPDLSLEEAAPWGKLASKYGLVMSMLIAPTTPPERQERIAASASGFLYYVSVQGTTGQRDQLPGNLQAQVKQLKQSSRLPVLVGFGIGTRAHVQEVCEFADGAIVGSAIVSRITAAISLGNPAIGQFDSIAVRAVEELVRDLAFA